MSISSFWADMFSCMFEWLSNSCMNRFGLLAMQTFNQEKIEDALVFGDTVVHVITDDENYREYYANKYKERIQIGVVKFGPTLPTERILKGGASCMDPNPKFKREANTRTAIVEWLCLAMCDDCYFTTGSSVTHYIRAQNARLHGGPSFGMDQEIGKYDLGQKPTLKFVNNCHKFVKSNHMHIRLWANTQLSHEQSAVLDFLNNAHLEDIYKTMNEFISSKDGRARAADVGQYLQKNCRVASLNRKKFLECPAKAGGQHWMKALLNTRLLHFSMTHSKVENEIHFDEDTHEIYTISKTNKRQLGTSSSSSTAVESTDKKMRTNL